MKLIRKLSIIFVVFALGLAATGCQATGGADSASGASSSGTSGGSGGY